MGQTAALTYIQTYDNLFVFSWENWETKRVDRPKPLWKGLLNQVILAQWFDETHCWVRPRGPSVASVFLWSLLGWHKVHICIFVYGIGSWEIGLSMMGGESQASSGNQVPNNWAKLPLPVWSVLQSFMDYRCCGHEDPQYDITYSPLPCGGTLFMWIQTPLKM